MNISIRPDLATSLPPDGWPILHIYGQMGPHDSVIITGSCAALRSLRNAIDSALASHKPAKTTASLMTSDGEGFKVHVFQADPPALYAFPMPFSDDSFSTPPSDPAWQTLREKID